MQQGRISREALFAVRACAILSSMENKFQTFREFFPYYLREHSKSSCRAWHYVGSLLALGCLGAFLVTFNWLFLLAAPIGGYGFAWASHALIEKNRPATFTYPGWSLMGDYYMLFLWVTGRLGRYLEAARDK